jgi:oxalate decarboxylase
MTSRHVASLGARTPDLASAAGSITVADASSFPILKRMSLRRLRLTPGGLREPHWHANAHELGCCVRGRALVTVALNHAARESFLVEAGEMFFAPSGSLHAIRNAGGEEAEFILAFSHERPEDFGLRAAFGAFTPAVLGNAFGLPAASLTAVAAATRTPGVPSIHAVPALPAIEPQARHASPLKFRIEAAQPEIASPAGSAKLASGALWPALEGLAMFSVRIGDEGMREPHWHPGTAEMGYVLQGQGRMTILDPDGSTDTYGIGPGDLYFIPRAYPHHIETTAREVLHILVFFDNPAPGDIGFRTLVGAFSRDTLAATLGVAEAALPDFPFAEDDPLIVGRINPVDPI